MSLAAAELSEPASVEAAYAELDSVVDRLRRTEQHRKRLIGRRRILFAFLLAHKERQSVVARRAGISAMAVSEAVGSAPSRVRKHL